MMTYHLHLQHLDYVAEGQALDPIWHDDAEDSFDSVFCAEECDRIAAAAPTEYLAGMWYGRALVLRANRVLTG